MFGVATLLMTRASRASCRFRRLQGAGSGVPLEYTMSQDKTSPVSRRTALAGAGVAGAAAAAATLLPRTPAAPAAAAATAAKVADTAAGYRESEHVLHYYRTARV